MTPRVLTDETFELGECPVWCAERRSLFWSDINAGAVWERDAAGTITQIASGTPVGALLLDTETNLLLFRAADIVRRTARELTPIGTFPADGAERFNDAIALADGSVLAGTIDLAAPRAGVYHYARDTGPRRVLGPTGISNGMALSPDQRWLYWSDSTAGTISRYALGPDGPDASSGTVLHTGDSTPDGLASDEEGCLWSARWGGSCVLRISPAGEVIDRVALPVPNVTSVAFGGSDLRSLYITTFEGPLYVVETDVRGLPEHRADIG
ncbi:MAG: SMP-30/gluconolactonase/LRE family protein [Planctomycetota bacterium]